MITVAWGATESAFLVGRFMPQHPAAKEGDFIKMSITLYDLCGADENHRFSPTCWRVKAALAHKGLSYETIPTPFTKIKEIVEGDQKTVPYIVDGETKVVDSAKIAAYLEETYPDAPSLFEGERGVAATVFMTQWAMTLVPQIAGLVVKDICDSLAPVDQEYFRTSREAMFKRTLDDVQAGRDDRIEPFRASLQPLRAMLAHQPYISGSTPLYPDYVVYGTIKWLVATAPFEVFAADDPVKTWFDAIDAIATA